MKRRTQRSLLSLLTLHWSVGFCLGFFCLFVGFSLLPTFVQTSPFLGGIAALLVLPPVVALIWGSAIFCWLGSVAAILKARRRTRLLATQTGLDSIRALSWQQFELLVAQAYRELGYHVTECGQGGADGGIDLLLRQGTQVILVQCKQWSTRRIGAPIVREQFGLLTHHRAQKVIIVSVGEFTKEARLFAQGKPIELVNGAALLQLIHHAQKGAPPPSQEKHVPVSKSLSPFSKDQRCPRCRSPMVSRHSKTTGTSFLGCTRFPDCRGTR